MEGIEEAMMLGASLLCSVIFIGISLFVVHAENIGWDGLSETWHFIFFAEGAIFFAQILLLILLSLINHPVLEKLSSFTELLFSYKLAVDPFIALLMFAKDQFVYYHYLPVVHNILLVGFLMHFVLLFLLIYNDLKGSEEISFISFIKFMITMTIPVILAILFLIKIIVQSEILYFGDLGFFLLTVTVIFIAVLIGNLFYAMEPYYIIRESSFFNPSSRQQIYKKKPNKKKRKRRKS